MVYCIFFLIPLTEIKIVLFLVAVGVTWHIPVSYTHLVLGGEDALNLDGGGSSTLWSGELPDKGIANTPSGSAERKDIC